MLGSSDYFCRHDAEPKAALEALVHHDGLLLLDLDETKYLMAAEFANRPLLDAVARRSGPTLFVSAGFQPIVAPLIAALGFAEAQIVASGLDTAEDRLRGKVATVLDALGEERWRKAWC